MKRKTSIYDTLLEMGFKEADGKYTHGDIVIPAEEAIGLTVDSFIEKMHRRGWMPSESSPSQEYSDYARALGIVWELQTNGTNGIQSNFTITQDDYSIWYQWGLGGLYWL